MSEAEGHGVSRRTVLRAAGGLGAAAGTGWLSGCGRDPSQAPGGGGTSAPQGSTAPSHKSGAGSVVLVVPLPTEQDKPFYESWLAKFTDQTGIKVELRSYPDSQFAQTITQLFSSGQIPDIYRMVKAPARMEASYQKGWIRPLDEYSVVTELLEKDYADALKDKATSGLYIDGHLYGVPAYNNAGWNSVRPLMYNQAMLDKYGVQPPTTWGELSDGAKKIHKDSKGDVYGLGLFGSNAPIVTSARLAAGPEIAMTFGVNLRTGKSDMSGQAMSGAVGLNRDLVKAGVVQPGWQTVSAQDFWREWAIGKIGMAFIAAWWGSQIQALNKDIKLGFSLSPAPDSGRKGHQPAGYPIPGRVAPYWGITKEAKNPDGAARLAAFLSSLEVQKDYYQRTKVVPALADRFLDDIDPTNRKLITLGQQEKTPPAPQVRFTDAFALVGKIKTEAPKPSMRTETVVKAIEGKVDWSEAAQKWDAAEDKVVAQEIAAAGAPKNVFTYPDWDPTKNYTTRK